MIKKAENYSSLNCKDSSYIVIQLSRDIYLEKFDIEIDQFFSSQLKEFKV